MGSAGPTQHSIPRTPLMDSGCGCSRTQPRSSQFPCTLTFAPECPSMLTGVLHTCPAPPNTKGPHVTLLASHTDAPAFMHITLGPPFPLLCHGIHTHVSPTPQRFIFKKAHMSHDDFRIYDGTSGRVVAVMHHFGKNPYGSLDPLGQSHSIQAHENRVSSRDLCAACATWVA